MPRRLRRLLLGPAALGSATTRPHVGHDPSGPSELGLRKRLQVSHQGMGLSGGGGRERGQGASPGGPAGVGRDRGPAAATRDGTSVTRRPGHLVASGSDRRHPVAAVGEGAVLALGQLEAADHLGPQVAEVDDGVDDQLGRQPVEVDVGLVTLALGLARTPSRSSGSSMAAMRLANTALTAASGPITAMRAVGSASVASGSNAGPDMA